MKLKIHYQNHGSVGVLLKFLLLQPFFFFLLQINLADELCRLQIYFYNVFCDSSTFKFQMATRYYDIEKWYL